MELISSQFYKEANLKAYWRFERTDDTNTKLLLHFDGIDGAVTTGDSATGKTPTFVGNAQIDTSQAKFGNASLLLDGTGDYITFPDSSDWAFGTGDFTIDMWLRFNSLSGEQYIIGQYVDGNNYWEIAKNADNTLTVFFGSGGVTKAYYVTSSAIFSSTGVWYHLAVVRNGTSLYVFLDGVSKSLIVNTAISTNDVGDIASVLKIGIINTVGYFNGWMDEVRIVKGTAKWTTNFTPPTSVYDCGMNDYLDNGIHLAPSGTPTDDAIKYGNGIRFTTASSQYATNTSASVINNITGSQTWSVWVKPYSLASYQHLVGMATSTGTLPRGFDIQPTTGQVIFYLAGLTTNSTVSSTTNLSVGNVYHLAGVYDSSASKLRLYINGSLSRELTASGTVTSVENVISIGRWGSRATDYANSSIDDFAIFDRALDATEIAALYTDQSLRRGMLII